MPVMKTTKGGKVAYKYGKSGKSYGDKSKAEKQDPATDFCQIAATGRFMGGAKPHPSSSASPLYVQLRRQSDGDV